MQEYKIQFVDSDGIEPPYFFFLQKLSVCE